MLPILFGFTTAISWGIADYFGGLASRKVSAYQVVLVTWMLGLGINPLIAIFSGEIMMPISGWIGCMLGGAFGAAGMILLYKLMAEGSMSIATSVSAVTAGAVTVLAGLFLEGFPDIVKIAGFLFALISVWMITTGGTETRGRIRSSEVILSILAGIFFSLYLILVNQSSQNHVFWPAVATRLAGVVVIMTYMLTNRLPWFPRKNVYGLLGINFVTDSIGTFAYILAGQVGRMDVAAVLGSLYPGMTIFLAWHFLKENLHRIQWLGILLGLTAVLMFSL